MIDVEFERFRFFEDCCIGWVWVGVKGEAVPMAESAFDRPARLIRA